MVSQRPEMKVGLGDSIEPVLEDRAHATVAALLADKRYRSLVGYLRSKYRSTVIPPHIREVFSPASTTKGN